MKLSTAKNKLDTVYSQYIRTKNARTDGCIACYTCERVYHWKKIQCGHYISRSYLPTRFCEMNTKPQCVRCNLHRGGASVDFREALIEEYGEEEVQKLEDSRHDIVKFDIDWYTEKIKHYADIVKEKMKHIQNDTP